MKTGLTDVWKKSSRSGGNGGQCIEARDTGRRVQIRDSKALGHGPILSVDPGAWTGFLGAVTTRRLGEPAAL